MPDIQNETQLQKEMENIINKVFNSVSDKILEKLKLQIQKDVFTEPNTWYERTGEFENAWSWGDIKKSINSITREMSYDTKNMRYDGRWVHGNPGRSSVENLADILNLAFNNYAAGYTSDLLFGQKHFSHFRRPYWENFIELLFDKNELENMLSKEFTQYGIVKS